MLSIIIASNRENNVKRIIENIAATAGISHEVIQIKEIEQGLSRCYNLGAGRSLFPYLCFVHDDVLFHTQDWGGRTVAHLQNEQAGVVGAMGGRYKSFFGAGWRDGSTESFRMNVKDGVEGGRLLVHNPAQKKTDEVICLDGAFLCCTKARWESHPFDGETFTGFHFYDLDFSLQMYRTGLKNVVAYDVLIEHFSQGHRELSFLNSFLLFQQKWKDFLPLSLETINQRSSVDFEGYALAETLSLMKRNRFSTKQRWRQLTLFYNRYKNRYHSARSFYFGFLK